MQKYFETLSDGVLKDLYQAFKVRNLQALEKKISDKNVILGKMFNLSTHARSIVLFILKEFYDKRPFAIDIAYKMNYQQKQLSLFFEYLESIKESGFIYYQKKRMRLNSNDDIVYFLPEIKDIVDRYTIKKESDISEDNIKLSDVKFVNKVFEKYEEFIVYLYNLGGVIEYSKGKFETLDVKNSDILELINANILNIYFLPTLNNKQIDSKMFICIDNSKVIDSIEKNIYKKIDNTTFVFNHLNILTDIDTFINYVDIETVKIDSDNNSKIDIKILTDNMTVGEIYSICNKLDLISSDYKNNIYVNNKVLRSFLECSATKRIDNIINNVFFDYRDTFKELLQIINRSEKDLSINDILKELKQQDKTYDFDILSKILYYMFSLGMFEIAFHEKSIIAIRKRVKNKGGKCIINGNYELTLIDYKTFDSEFIYVASIYFELEKQDSVYFYKITEDAILRGKSIETEKSKYTFDKMLNTLKAVLEESSLSIPKHIETSIRRWYDRVARMSLFENITVIRLSDIDKLDEVIFDAKKKDIIIKPINNEYAIIETTKSKKVLSKFFRQKKIIISI